MKRAQELVAFYMDAEFGEDEDYKLPDDLSEINLAYTTTEDEKHEITADLNLVDFRIQTKVDGQVVRTEQYSSLQDIVENGLEGMLFDDLVYVSNEELAPFYAEHDELDDVDPAVIRQQLANSGIVNGQVVDEDKLNNDSFIQQVYVDAEDAAREQEQSEEKPQLRSITLDLTAPEQDGANSDLLGKRLRLDDRDFKIIKVNTYGDVSLEDLTFKSATGYPIVRIEKVDFVRRALEQQEQEQEKTITPASMDKESPAVRKYIAQRAELLGAIRLPNNTFKGNAGTEVVSDILILQKRDRIIDIEPDWVHLGEDENGIRMNSYFVDHPDMILGEMKMVSGRFKPESTCIPYENTDLESLLDEAISNIHGELTEYELDDDLEEEDNSIPADPTVRNFSYTLYDGKIYFRENSRMVPVEASATAENRIKGLIEIRDSVRRLLELQTEDYPDSEIKAEQQHLNKLYDDYTAKYGLINSRGNSMAFSQDSSYSLLTALEVLDDEGNLERKADMFFKRTVKPHTPVTSVDTASEAHTK